MNRALPAIVISGVLLAQLVVNLVWLGADHWDPMRIPDGFAHAGSLVHLQDSLYLGGVSALPAHLREIHSFYPVLGNLPRAVAGAVTGAQWAPRVANLLYLALLLVGVYLVARRCADRRSGLLAVALVALTPAVHGGSRVVGLDYPLLCCTPLAVYLLLASDGLRRLPQAAGFGLLAGLAATVKGQALLFLLWPAAVTLVRGARASYGAHGTRGLWRPARGAMLALACLALVSSVWWAGRVPELLDVLAGHATGARMLHYESDPSVLGGVSFYLLSLPLSLSGPLTVALLAALVPFARRARFRWEILAWLVLPLVLHAVLKVRHFRYLFPLVPAAAVIVAVGVYSLRQRWNHAVAAALVAVGIALWLGCAFSTLPDPTQRSPLTCVPRRGPEFAGVTRLLLACGDCSYAGPPAPSGPHPLHGSAQQAATWLGRRHPGGRGVLLGFDAWRHTLSVPVMLWLREQLPAMRVRMVQGVRRERLSWPSDLAGKRQRYQLVLTDEVIPKARQVFKIDRGEEQRLVLWKLSQ